MPCLLSSTNTFDSDIATKGSGNNLDFWFEKYYTRSYVNAHQYINRFIDLESVVISRVDTSKSGISETLIFNSGDSKNCNSGNVLMIICIALSGAGGSIMI